MRKSDHLAAQESDQESSLTKCASAPGDRYIKPNEHGVITVYPITCFDDYVAIAVLPRPETTKGGIVIADASTALPDTGIVVGAGVKAVVSIGDRVKFIPKFKAANLDGEFPEYGSAEIQVYKFSALVVKLSPISVHIAQP